MNKIDRTGARHEGLLEELRDWLTPGIVPMGRPSWLGTRAAGFEPFAGADRSFAALLAERLSDNDDEILAAYVNGESLAWSTLAERLADQARRALVHPVLFGAALTGTGVDDLMATLPMLAPEVDDGSQPFSGAVFKVERAPTGERLAYVRIRSGSIRPRDVVPIAGRSAKVTGVRVFNRGGAHQPRAPMRGGSQSCRASATCRSAT